MTGFTYRQQSTAIHQMDPRVKTICFIMVNVASTYFSWVSLAILSGILGALLIYTKQSLLFIGKETRFLLFFLVIVIAARSFSFGGSSDSPLIHVSIQGLQQGVVFAWRILIIVLWGVLFTQTTSQTEIKTTIQWALGPIPFVPEKKIAIMISLMIRFLPLILEQSREISDAQKSRCIQNRKNPIYRVRAFLVPFVRRVFGHTDTLADAMMSRCYTEDRTEAEFQTQRSDWIILMGTALTVMSLTLL